jgi:hypothetical protein
MNYIAKVESGPTHPGRTARMAAIEKGWQKAALLQEIAATKAQPRTQL